MDFKPEIVSPHICELAESPIWDAENNRIYWVDIVPGVLHWYNYGDLTKHELFIGMKLSAVALAGENRLVAVLQDGFYYIDIKKKSIAAIALVENELPDNRFNDGKCDPAGRFWAGSMSMAGDLDAGKLYMLDNHCRVTTQINHVGCSNGLAWNIDHSVFYFIDTLRCSIAAYDFDVFSGKISCGRIVKKFNQEEGFPDGMTIDSEGALWVAMWDAGNVSRYNSLTGELILKIELPVSQISSCTFGGANLSDLFITTARTGLNDIELANQLHAGHVFVVRGTEFTGLRAISFSPNF